MKKFEVITNNKIKKEREQVIVLQKSFLNHIENDKIRLVFFDSNESMSNFTFELTEGEVVWNIPFEMELVVDTIILEFEGSHLPDSVRIMASQLLEEIIFSTRFLHKDKFWSLSNYHVLDLEHYKVRLEKEYAASIHDELKKIKNISEIEKMDIEDYHFFEAEEIDDLALWLSGDDAKLLCEYMEEHRFIKSFQKVNENRYEVILMKQKDPVQMINAKIIFARELSLFGYNIWTDYPE